MIIKPEQKASGKIEETKAVSQQEERTAQLRKTMDACVTARAELYKAEMLLRVCNKCVANGGKP